MSGYYYDWQGVRSALFSGRKVQSGYRVADLDADRTGTVDGLAITVWIQWDDGPLESYPYAHQFDRFLTEPTERLLRQQIRMARS